MANWVQLLVTGVTMGSVYSLIALGFVIIYRSYRIVNAAQGSFVMLGGLLTFSMLLGTGLPYWLSGTVGVVLVAALAVLMYLLVLKPILNVSLARTLLCTVALSFLFENLALAKYGDSGRAIPGFASETSFEVRGVYFSRQAVWMVGILVIILAGLYLFNNHTAMGKRMTAAAANPLAARLSGISVGRMVMLAFAISAGIGAVGGITASSYVGGLSYTTGSLYGMNGFVAAVLGGWGSTSGAVVGGLALGIVQSLATRVVPAGYSNVVAFAILLIVLYFRPRGLLGTDKREGEV